MSARTGADILAEIQPTIRRGTAHVCLRPDLIDEWEKAQADLEQAQIDDAGSGRLAQGGTSAKTRKAAERVREIETQIEAADLALTFEKVSKTRFSELCDENPPREKNTMDMMAGYNREAVDNDLAFEMLVDPVFEHCTKRGCTHDQNNQCGSWEYLIKLLGPGDWEEIVTVVRDVNGAVAGAPKSGLASRILDRPASGSGRRGRGA